LILSAPERGELVPRIHQIFSTCFSIFLNFLTRILGPTFALRLSCFKWKREKVQKKIERKEKNNLNHNKLIKESLRELLGTGLVEGKERTVIDRNFLRKYAVSAKSVH
jgi:hypothetical protein